MTPRVWMCSPLPPRSMLITRPRHIPLVVITVLAETTPRMSPRVALVPRCAELASILGFAMGLTVSLVLLLTIDFPP